MINTVADLLQELKDAEVKRLDSLKIKHRPTIGNMHEGLVGNILEKALFKGFNINIVKNSFIRTANGTRSEELDIMIIEGHGKQLPYTDQYDVEFDKVIAVIQVKKTLNTAQLESAYSNLKNVYDISEFKSYPDYSKRMFRNSYRGICQEDIFERGRTRKTFKSSTTELIYHMSRLEALMPARIVFGYNGFTSEYGLRQGFVKFLSANKSKTLNMKPGFGPLNFPDLILNNQFSLVKANCLPYAGRMTEYQWPFFLSSSENPLLKLLEIIWTRLSYKYKLSSEIFGDDLELEGMNAFLFANLVYIDGVRGWNYEYIKLTNNKLQKQKGNSEWLPVALSDAQHHIIAYLCKYNSIYIGKINRSLSSIQISVDTEVFVKEIIETGLVYKDGPTLKLLTERCSCVYIPNEGYYAAENKSEQLTKWCDKRFPNQCIITQN
ncbi:DUF6602 domain-containing protein [Xanthocytophaga agilis]|uniref:DUF6602 domain-containing protein n=1 Tax=Xanthocytophaga agilis TaxID=3048010 RepID=A0AAE3RBA3_9BACT|nr:DUF6602 domain-containing protein [Xanthocytophaga agilis]MDJ1505017.1 hypothetical protein [Xanthocytophaga agilis]